MIKDHVFTETGVDDRRWWTFAVLALAMPINIY